MEQTNQPTQKIPKLEVLSQIGRNAVKGTFDFLKGVGNGYACEQLTSTFNIPGYRFAKKHLNYDWFKNGLTPFGSPKAFGELIGSMQDFLIFSAGFLNFIGYTPTISPDNKILQLAGIALGAKLITNAVAYPCSKLSDTYKTAKKQLQDVKVKAEGN